MCRGIKKAVIHIHKILLSNCTCLRRWKVVLPCSQLLNLLAQVWFLSKVRLQGFHLPWLKNWSIDNYLCKKYELTIRIHIIPSQDTFITILSLSQRDFDGLCHLEIQHFDPTPTGPTQPPRPSAMEPVRWHWHDECDSAARVAMGFVVRLNKDHLLYYCFIPV